MLYTIPDYYKEFTCKADQCEDTCCAGWLIAVDKRSLKKYRAVRGDYKKILRKRINWCRGTFRQDKNKRCAFLNDDNLCDMYIHLGKDSLCRTCRLYPRHIEEFEGVREMTYSISCPEVARILLNKQEKVRFWEKENEKEEIYDEFDSLTYFVLVEARKYMLEVLQRRTLPVKIRAGLIYEIAYIIDSRAEHQILSCEEVLDNFREKAGEKTAEISSWMNANEKDFRKIYQYQKELFHHLYRLELLKADWNYQLLEVEKWLFTEDSFGNYQKITEEFGSWIQTCDFSWEIQKEQLLVYFISTYFCGAVYDGRILKKVMLAISMVELLEEMLKARWLQNEKTLDMEDVIELTYRFSREVEHSDKNLNELEALLPEKHARYWSEAIKCFS